MYGCLDETKLVENYPVGAGVLVSPDPRPPEAPEEEPFQGVDLAETVLNHVYQLNGRNVDRITLHRSQRQVHISRLCANGFRLLCLAGPGLKKIK